MRNDNSMTDATFADTSSQAPVSAPLPPKPSRCQRFLAFPVTRIALYLLIFGVIVAVVSVVLGGLLHLMPHRRGSNFVLIITLGEGIAAASAVLAFWVMVRFMDKRSWATAGFSRQGLAAGLGSGFALGAAMLTIGVLALRVLGVYHVSAVVPRLWVLAPILTYLAVAVFEETLFRGYIFQTLEGRWGSGVALAVTSLLFGLTHLGNPVPGASHWMRLAGPLQLCFEAGLPLGAAYLLTRRWWLSIGIHWAWDYFEGPV